MRALTTLKQLPVASEVEAYWPDARVAEESQEDDRHPDIQPERSPFYNSFQNRCVAPQEFSQRAVLKMRAKFAGTRHLTLVSDKSLVP